MTRFFRNLILLFFPFLMVILLNEYHRWQLPQQEKSSSFSTTLPLKTKCTWACHNNTAYCKTYHVKLVKSHFEWTDKLYFGLINGLKSSGEYRLANIVFLGLIWPILMYFLLVKNIDLYLKIRRIKQAEND